MLLPFVGVGAAFLATRVKPVVYRAVTVLAVVCMVVWPAWLSWFTYKTEGGRQNTLRAISPVTTNSIRVMQVAEFLKHKAGDGSVLIIDVDPHGYDDLQLGFYSGFAYEKLARLRSPMFERRVSDGQPRWLVTFDGGTVQLENGTYRGIAFDEVGGFEAPFHVYAAR